MLMPHDRNTSRFLNAAFRIFKGRAMTKTKVIFSSTAVWKFMKIRYVMKITCMNTEASEQCQLPTMLTAEVIALRTETDLFEQQEH
jgi:hypothetical protein